MTLATPGTADANYGIGATAAPRQLDASQQLAAVTASEWGTYLQHFVPEENQLIQYAMDPNKAGENMKLALGMQEQANTQAEGIQARRLAQEDVKLTPEQQAIAEKQRGISNATANVTAQNKAKDVTVANQMGILGAPMSGVTGSI